MSAPKRPPRTTPSVYKPAVEQEVAAAAAANEPVRKDSAADSRPEFEESSGANLAYANDAVAEIVKTEVAYCETISVLLDEHLPSLDTAGTMPTAAFNKIKAEVGQMLGMSKDFLAALRTNSKVTASDAARAFLEMQPQCSVFGAYNESYAIALQSLEKAKDDGRPMSRSIATALFKPVQRIKKYVQLFTALVNSLPAGAEQEEAKKAQAAASAVVAAAAQKDTPKETPAATPPRAAAATPPAPAIQVNNEPEPAAPAAAATPAAPAMVWDDEEVFMAGYMTKRGGSIKSWKRRYFALNMNGLTYAVSRDEAAIDTLDVQEMDMVRPALGDVQRANTLELICLKRSYFCYPDTGPEYIRWISALGNAIDACALGPLDACEKSMAIETQSQLAMASMQTMYQRGSPEYETIAGQMTAGRTKLAELVEKKKKIKALMAQRVEMSKELAADLAAAPAEDDDDAGPSGLAPGDSGSRRPSQSVMMVPPVWLDGVLKGQVQRPGAKKKDQWKKSFAQLESPGVLFFYGDDKGGKPSDVVPLLGYKIESHEDKNHPFCISISHANVPTVIVQAGDQTSYDEWFKAFKEASEGSMASAPPKKDTAPAASPSAAASAAAATASPGKAPAEDLPAGTYPQVSDISSKPLLEWGNKEVDSWLQRIGLEQYRAQFRANDITGQEVADLRKTELLEIGVNQVGHRVRFAKALVTLTGRPYEEINMS